MQFSSRRTADVTSSRRQWTCSCASSANAWKLTPCSATWSSRSAVYRMNRRGLSTGHWVLWYGTWDVDGWWRTAPIDNLESSAREVWTKPLEHDASQTILTFESPHQQVVINSSSTSSPFTHPTFLRHYSHKMLFIRFLPGCRLQIF